MNFNATLIGQSITFLVFVWFCMKFLWPPLMKAMDERRERIAEGLAASDRAEKELETAKAEVDRQIAEARDKAGEIIDQASQRQAQIIVPRLNVKGDPQGVAVADELGRLPAGKGVASLDRIALPQRHAV